MRKWQVAAAAAVIVGALGLVGEAQQGQGYGPGPGPRFHGQRGRAMGPMGPMWQFGFAMGQLGLTDAQREQIRTIVQGHRGEMRQLGQRARDARQALRKATEAEPFDESVVRNASNGLSTVMADQAVLRAKVRAEVMLVLTPEQRAKAAELRTQAEQRRQQWQEQRRQRMDERRQRNQAAPKPGV